jgi:hypothetical protein
MGSAQAAVRIGGDPSPKETAMPGLVADDGVYQQPEAFRTLDRFVNDERMRDIVGQFHADLVGVAAGTAEPNFGPFGDDEAMRTHWGTDWINESGRGGSFWPYLTEVDIYAELTRALTQSIGRAHRNGKEHLTVWLPVHEAVKVGAPLSAAAQQRLFVAAVHETDTQVQLVIVTPEPAGS